MGFDIECILDIQSLAGEYFCPVCRTLVYPNEALQSQCTHLYCKPCLTYVVGGTRACPYDGYLVTEADSKPLIESNKALAETIGKIEVRCLYHRSGCTWKGPLSECTSHCSGCAFGNSPVVCNRCGIQIVHRQVHEHAQNCPGVNPQVQQAAEGVQDVASSGTAADQSQTATQSGAPTSQVQTSQTTTAPPPGQDNQQANANSQVPAQAVAPAAVPTPEQWYQQQYQQYYQQYPGYDPYQQPYQQYYPYQQQAIQQFQQHPPHVQGQHQPQVYTQPQPQPQPQPQLQPQPQPQPQPQLQPLVQPQPQPQAQPQPQPPTHSQPQPQIPPHGQPQPRPHVQVPVAPLHQNQAQVNPQQQLHPAVQPHTQIQSQTHPAPHGHLPPQPHPQAQTHSIQPQPQQHMQISQYQQPHSQMHHPQMHPQSQSQVHLQPHPQAQSQPHSQGQSQSQPQHHPQLHPPQANQPPIPNAQPQTQYPLAHAVTGHHSYLQPQAHQPMQLGAPQQHAMHPSSGSLPPAQLHGQFPQPPPQMRPPQSHAPMPNQQQPALLSSQGQLPSIPPTQQQQITPHGQQPGHPVHQRPVMQPIQQPVPQQHMQQQQPPFPGQALGPVQSQLHQHGHFAQQQPMQPQLRPQGPPYSVQLTSHSYLQSQQNVALAHGMQPQQSQNYVGRPVMPNHGVQSQPFPQSPGAFGVAAQVRPMQLGLNQPSVNQNYVGRTNHQLQTSSEQQFSQSGPTVKPTVLERKGDHISEKSVTGREAGSPSQKTAEKDVNGIGADSVEVKALKSETVMNDEQKPIGEGEDNSRQGETLVKDADSEMHGVKDGSGEPVIKQTVKEEGTESCLEPSPGVVSVEEKDASSFAPKEVERSLVDGSSSLRQAEPQGRFAKGAVDVSVRVSTGVDKGSQIVPLVSVSNPADSVQNSQTSLIGRDRLQHGYQERNLSQAQVTPQGSGVDEFGGFQGKGFVHSSHPVPLVDQGRHQLPPMHYGSSTYQQRPAAPSMLQPVPPLGPPPHAQVPGHPPTLLRPQGPGQPLNPPEHFQPPVLKQSHGSFHPDIPLGGVPGPGSSTSFGRGPGHFGPPQRSFELQSSAPQGHYNQGHVPPSHGGLSRTSQGEPVGGPPLVALPPGSIDPQGGIMGRAPHGPEGQFGPQRPVNPGEAEMFSNQRPHRYDGRQSDSHLPGSLERGPFGQHSGFESNMMRMNGAPGLDSSSARGLRDERFKTSTEERLNPYQGEFEEDFKRFPRPSRLDNDPAPKFGSYFSSSRPIDRGPHGFGMDAASRPLDKASRGFNYDAGLKLDPGAGGAPPRFLPPFHPGGTLHPNDAGERALPVGLHDDNRGRADSARTHPDFLGPGPGFGRHPMEHLTPRSPGREYLGIPSRGFGGLSGVPRGQSGLDDIDGRETRSFGEGSRSYNLPSDPVGNSFHESRFPFLPGQLRRGELDGAPHNHLRSGDLIGQDILPSHLRRGELLNLPSHFRLGEPTGFGPFPGHARMGELAGPGSFPRHLPLGESFGGNKSSHPRLGEPGFRSSYSLQGFPNDGGLYTGDKDSLDKSRKRKPASTGWCRICKIDCETVEGLDLHSQTREHQKMAMDMVISIKQQNTKKQRISNDHSAVEEASKSRNAGFEGRGNKP